MATTDQEGNKYPPDCPHICACGPLVCTCSASSPTKMAATDQEGNILPVFCSSRLSSLSPLSLPPPRTFSSTMLSVPSPAPPTAVPSTPVITPCERWGVLPAADHHLLPALSMGQFAKVCDIAVKTKQQLDSAQREIKKMNKVLKSRKRRAASTNSMPSTQAQHIDGATQVSEAPVSSLSISWANLLVELRSQASSQIQEMRATIAAKDCQLKHQNMEMERLNTKVATLTHENNLAHLALQQNMSTYSSSTTGSVSITGSVFDSTLPESEPDTLEVTKSPDVSLPSPAQVTRRREESGQITKMLDSVDKLAKQYSPKDRYHQPKVANLSQLRSEVVPDSLFNYELAALWMFAEVPTEEETVQYDRLLENELRPPPIHSPPLRRPYVNWTTLNKHRRKNLPDPQLFPVYSVPVDPSFYTDATKYKPADKHITDLPSGLMATNKQCGCSACVPPFGLRHGLMTDMGVIGMPTDPVHGYCWDDDTGGWVIATGCC